MTRLCALVLVAAIALFGACSLALHLDAPVVGLWLASLACCCIVGAVYVQVNAVICPQRRTRRYPH